MLLPLPYHRGQKRPWPSLPRINWAHPLTRGLVSYGYDNGAGPIDLISGRLRTVVFTAMITGNRTSKIGSGILYTGSANTGSGCQITLPTTVPFASITTNGVYSYAVGAIHTAAPLNTGCQLYGSGDSSTSTPFALVTDSTNTDVLFEFGNTSTITSTANAALANVYHTYVGVASPSGTGAGYVDGKLNVGPTSGLTTAITQAGAQPQFQGFSTTSQAGQAYQAGYIFYGAAWNRPLVAQEAFILHNDPWCFLIYPEDEIFAELVGVAAAANNPFFSGDFSRPLWIRRAVADAQGQNNLGLLTQPVPMGQILL